MAGYGTDAGLTAWLASNGLTLPSGASTLAVLRQRGSDYLDAAYSAKLKCSTRTGGFTQERAWPRTGHTVTGVAVDPSFVPLEWINASYRAAWIEATQSGWASGTSDPYRITKREKAGEVEREFFGVADTGANPGMSGNSDAQIDGMIALWLCASGYYGPAIFVV